MPAVELLLWLAGECIEVGVAEKRVLRECMALDVMAVGESLRVGIGLAEIEGSVAPGLIPSALACILY